MTLAILGSVDLPPHQRTGFDHGDVHLASGRIFVAHTAQGTVEVIDGDALVHTSTIPGCPEGSGVLCIPDEGLVFAAARAGGKVLVIDPASLAIVTESATGPRPNGLYDARADRFLVNVRDPACVAVLAGDPPRIVERWPVSSEGPHGLDVDADSGRAFVACDGGAVVALDLSTGREVDRVDIAGPPDAIWFNPHRRVLYVAIGRPGLVDVIDTAAMRRCQQVATEEGAHTAAFDRVRQRLAVFLPRTCRAAIYQET